MFVSMRNVAVSFSWQVFWCLSLGDALTFHTSMFPYFCNVFLHYTLRTMCNSSLGVWKNILSFCWFVCLFIIAYFFFKKKIFVVKFELNCNYGLHFIGLLKFLNTSCL
jgi:hypothetical protein